MSRIHRSTRSAHAICRLPVARESVRGGLVAPTSCNRAMRSAVSGCERSKDGWGIRRDGTGNMLVHDYFHEVLRHSGRPVLVVPEGNTAAMPLKRAVIEMTRYLWRPMQGPTVNSQAVDTSMAALRMAEMLMAPYRLPGFA